MTNFKIQIISDTVCPWCYVGYRRLSRAITAHQGKNPLDTFTLTWNAFYLNPAAPEFPGADKAKWYAVKFGPERTAAMFSRLSAIGEGEGIKFSFGGNTGKTRDSHRLLWYAGQLEEAKRADTPSTSAVVGGLQTRVAENLFRAYFEDEKNITDPRVLLEAGVEAGLDREEVKKLLDSEEGGAEVDSEAKTASRRLVTGVPYFSIQGKYSVEGADEPETFLEIFEQIKEDEQV
ncbi:putative thioredoxin [Penicillium brasilianum]|uniref:Putative thioredoxin n=1 Tax=Penicillium brasilianum TaxID=104259 RepID=A0A1S9RFQ2_PENBI|nr:putative thioredoxin [Penicillium brasilianum]